VPFSRLAPEGLAARIVLGVVTTAGVLYANLGPVIVSGLAATPGYSAETAGYVFSLNLYGSMLGGLVVVPFVARADWRPLAATFLVLALLADVASTLVHAVAALYALRFAHGFACGAFLGLAASVIARAAAPERTFAFYIAVQITLGGVGAMALTGIAATDGIRVVWICLAAYGALALMLLPWLDPYSAQPRRAAGADTPDRRAPWSPVALSLAALFLYQAGQMAAFAYTIEFGHHHGLDDNFIGTAVAISLWIGGPSAILVAWWSTRSGRLRPVFAGMLLTAVAVSLFALSDPGTYFAANVGLNVMFSMTFPYLMGVAAEMDNTGRLAAVAGFVSASGLATGPAIAATLLVDGAYEPVIAFAVLALTASALLVLLPAQTLDRRNFRGRVVW
jgi:predicted MFS family arabinose efflux permease